MRQSIKLLTIEYQKGRTSYEERAHFLVFKKKGPLCPPPIPRPLNPSFSFQYDRLLYNMEKICANMNQMKITFQNCVFPRAKALESSIIFFDTPY